MEHGADIDAVVSELGPGWGGVGWGRLEAGLEVPKETEMLDPAVGMRASGCLGRTRGCSKPSFLAQDIKSGRSPLIHAVENNSLSMVQLLLQVGTAPFPWPLAHPLLWP